MMTVRILVALACLAIAAPVAAQQGGSYAMTHMDNRPAGEMEYVQEWGNYSVFAYSGYDAFIYIENMSTTTGAGVLDGYFVTTAEEVQPCPSGPAQTHMGGEMAPSWGRVQVETGPDRRAILMRMGVCNDPPTVELGGNWQD
jgi:hypothetical protein